MVEHEQKPESDGLRRKRERIRQLEADAREAVERFEQAGSFWERLLLAGRAKAIEAELHAVAATPADGYQDSGQVARVEVNR